MAGRASARLGRTLSQGSSAGDSPRKTGRPPTGNGVWTKPPEVTEGRKGVTRQSSDTSASVSRMGSGTGGSIGNSSISRRSSASNFEADGGVGPPNRASRTSRGASKRKGEQAAPRTEVPFASPNSVRRKPVPGSVAESVAEKTAENGHVTNQASNRQASASQALLKQLSSELGLAAPDQRSGESVEVSTNQLPPVAETASATQVRDAQEVLAFVSAGGEPNVAELIAALADLWHRFQKLRTNDVTSGRHSSPFGHDPGRASTSSPSSPRLLALFAGSGEAEHAQQYSQRGPPQDVREPIAQPREEVKASSPQMRPASRAQPLLGPGRVAFGSPNASMRCSRPQRVYCVSGGPRLDMPMQVAEAAMPAAPAVHRRVSASLQQACPVGWVQPGSPAPQPVRPGVESPWAPRPEVIWFASPDKRYATGEPDASRRSPRCSASRLPRASPGTVHRMCSSERTAMPTSLYGGSLTAAPPRTSAQALAQASQEPVNAVWQSQPCHYAAAAAGPTSTHRSVAWASNPALCGRTAGTAQAPQAPQAPQELYEQMRTVRVDTPGHNHPVLTRQGSPGECILPRALYEQLRTARVDSPERHEQMQTVRVDTADQSPVLTRQASSSRVPRHASSPIPWRRDPLTSGKLDFQDCTTSSSPVLMARYAMPCPSSPEDRSRTLSGMRPLSLGTSSTYLGPGSVLISVGRSGHCEGRAPSSPAEEAWRQRLPPRQRSPEQVSRFSS
mmetsp:Transcript_56126/g.121447  ORF Transcript_56126/g.121447 Transcript_56126/m.121447 type:complete len:732 (+) Transcript_56126:52-2247(+)